MYIAFDIRNINKPKLSLKHLIMLMIQILLIVKMPKNILDNIKDLNEALSEKEKEIQNNNKNRSQPKFKGAEDIYNDFSSSVVFIGNRKK